MQIRFVVAGLLGLAMALSIVEGSKIESLEDLEKAIKDGDTETIRQSESQVQKVLAADKQSCAKSITVRQLEDLGFCTVTVLDYALENDLSLVVRQCLKQDVRLDKKKEYAMCSDPLEVAVMKAMDAKGDKRLETTRLLLEAGAEPNILLRDVMFGPHTTLINQATAKGDAEMVALLLEYGALPGEQDSAGNTAMHLAVKHCNADLIFIIFKADRSQAKTENQQGQTPMQVAGEAWDNDEQCRKQVEDFVGELTKYADGTRAHLKDKFKTEISKAKSWFRRGKSQK